MLTRSESRTVSKLSVPQYIQLACRLQEAICHEGSKATRAIYLRNGLVFTTGFSKMSERQYSLRAPNHLNDPIVMVELDTSNGVMFPLYDADTNMVYLCGKVTWRCN